MLLRVRTAFPESSRSKPLKPAPGAASEASGYTR